MQWRFIQYVTLEDAGHDLQVTVQPQYNLQNTCDLLTTCFDGCDHFDVLTVNTEEVRPRVTVVE